MDNPETFTDRLIEEIIDAATDVGVDLSVADVNNIAIYTLHSILTSNSGIETIATKKGICDIIGNDNRISEYLSVTLSGISATNDAINNEIGMI